MGAGQFPACVRLGDRAGIDPLYVPVIKPVTPPPVALSYDPGKRAYVQNADGTMVQLDVVDAQVALLLGIEAGSIPSAVTFGNKLRAALNRSLPSKQAQIASQEVNRVLGPLIARGAVQVLSVVVDSSGYKRGALSVAVTYANLTLAGNDGQPPQKTVTF